MVQMREDAVSLGIEPPGWGRGGACSFDPHCLLLKAKWPNPTSTESGTCPLRLLHLVSFMLHSSEKRDPSSFILIFSLPPSFSPLSLI